MRKFFLMDLEPIEAELYAFEELVSLFVRHPIMSKGCCGPAVLIIVVYEPSAILRCVVSFE